MKTERVNANNPVFMKNPGLFLIIIFLNFLVAPPAQCFSAADSTKINHKAAVEFRTGYVFPTHRFFKGTNAAGKPVDFAVSAHLKYAFHFSGNTATGRKYPFAWQGIGLSYNDFLNPSEVGRPIALYVFQNSRIATLAPGLNLSCEWDFGASFGWKQFDEKSNPLNMVVGSAVNAYMSLGLFIDWNLKGGWNFIAGAHLTHYSNGNTSYPNAGVNIIEGRAGLSYRFRSTGDRLPESPRGNADSEFRRHVSYDVVVYGALRKKGFYLQDGEPYVVPGSFAVAGLNFNPMYNFSKYFKAGLSLDFQYDESANIRDHIANDYVSSSSDLKFHRPPFAEQFAAGISVRAEIMMPIFSINLGIGRNVICRGSETEVFYQMLILKTHITRSAYIHVGYQLTEFKNPSNLMLGLGFTFNNKR